MTSESFQAGYNLTGSEILNEQRNNRQSRPKIKWIPYAKKLKAENDINNSNFPLHVEISLAYVKSQLSS